MAHAALGSDAPKNVYVSPCLPILECDLLTVWVPSIQIPPITQPTTPAAEIMHKVTRPHFNMVSFQLVVARCIPVAGVAGKAPAKVAVEKAAQRILSDGWILWNAIRKTKKDGTLLPPPWYELQVDPAIAISGQGGMGGWTLTIQAALGGYDPANI